MDCDKARTLLPAYVDGELGISEALDMGAHLEHCVECSRQHAGDAMIHHGMRRRATYHAAPAHLATRVRKALPASRAAATQPRVRRWDWSHAGAAFATIAALAWSISLYLGIPDATERLGQEAVSAHMRSLVGDRAIDVASSDRHTVKPWFNGKIDYAPDVLDLTAQGFPLVGGRLDYLADRRVAVLVYRHRQHLIDLFVWPSGDGAAGAPRDYSRNGYHAISWKRAGMNYLAVSDLDPVDLSQFQEVLHASVAN